MGKSPQKSNPPGKPLMFAPEEVAAALRANHGNVSATARSLKCDRTTVLNYCQQFPSVQAAREEGVEIRIDRVEEKWEEAVERGESWAIQLGLRGQGAKRGHSEKTETTINLDYSRLTTEQLQQIAAGKDPLAVLAGSSS